MAQVELESALEETTTTAHGDHFWLVHTPAALKIFVVARDEQLAIETAQAHFEDRHWRAEDVEFEAEELTIPDSHLSGVVYAVWEAEREDTDLEQAKRDRSDFWAPDTWVDPEGA